MYFNIWAFTGQEDVGTSVFCDYNHMTTYRGIEPATDRK